MSFRSSMLDDNGFRDWSMPSPQSSLFPPQNQNPLYNQTLEEAFSALSVSVSPFNNPSFDFVGNGPSDFYGASKILSFNGYGAVPFQTSNLGQMQGNNVEFNKPDSAQSSSYDRFLDSEPLVRQREFLGAFPSVPLVQQKPPGVLLNRFLGNVRSLAKDQNGCRTLQETMKELTTEELSVLFLELIDIVTELMVHPFGNYVVQKMVEICSQEQRTQIILMVTQLNLQLVRICLNPYGTRAVEHLLEHVTTQEQKDLIMSALIPGAVALAKDTHGCRVFLYCLKHFTEEDNEVLFNMVAMNSFAIATDKNGCRVLNQCVDRARGETKWQLIASIIVNASVLADDCYGNYVVQHLLSLRIPAVTESIWGQLTGKFLYLAQNKFGSNVVEKFLQYSGEQYSTWIILELLYSPNVAMLLVDPYGNYVIKSALSVSKGVIHIALLDLIELNSTMMRNNLYGKKLLAKFEREKLRSTRTVTGFYANV